MILCEICSTETPKPVLMTFKHAKTVTWKICEGCTLVLTNYIKRMAKANDL